MTSAGAQTLFSFTQEDLILFSEASGDRNPLHLSEEYARQTPYGQPVVFGCLGAIACLGHWPADRIPESIEAEFLRPTFAGVVYRVETSEKEGAWQARLFDGSTLMVSVTVTSARSQSIAEIANFADSVFARHEPVSRPADDLVQGLEVSGRYASSPSRLAALVARWGNVNPQLAALLCWASYLVGMELPGESALFSKLRLRLSETRPEGEGMLYRASVATVNARSGQIKMDVSLSKDDATMASGECWSFLRAPVPAVEEIDLAGVRPDSLAGRSVVLLGSSRGLGAAIKRALEARGAAVYGLARSGEADDASRMQIGDAGDAEAVECLRQRVCDEQGRVDFLICNACPPVLPLRLEPNSAARIAEFISLAVSLTLIPLAAFLDLLNRSEGCAVIVSSAAVEDPVREWPHYVAAKRAVEALGSIASLQYPRVHTLIVRPHKLLTALTNTPMGRVRAASPAELAARIAERLEGPREAGKTEIMT